MKSPEGSDSTDAATVIITHAPNDGGSVSTPSCADLANELVDVVRSGRSDLATKTNLIDEAVVQDSRRDGVRGHR